MIREAIRESVQLAAGDADEAVRRFHEWLTVGGKERVLAYFAEISPHVTMTAKLDKVIAEVISETEGHEEGHEDRALEAIGEKLDPRENPTLHGVVAKETGKAIARYVAHVFEEELQQYRKQT